MNKAIVFLKKFIFFFKKPSVVIVVSQGRFYAGKAIFEVLRPHFKIRKSDGVLPFARKDEVLLFQTDLKDSLTFKNLRFLLKRSRLPVLVVTHVGEIPSDRYSFTGDKKETFLARKLAEVLPEHGFLVLNFDDEVVREIRNETIAQTLTFGFPVGADFQITDVNVNEVGTNFKVNNEGDIVPFWLEKVFGKEQIYSALAGVCVGKVKGINLVEASQALRSYRK